MTEVRDYYVSMIRGRRVAYLAGPYEYLTEAMRRVDEARTEACKVDLWAHFDLFGTCSLPRAVGNPKGVLNSKLIGLDNP